MALLYAWWLQLFLVCACISGINTVSNRPNILFILADDLGWNDIGYHNPAVRTPNLDKLAERGIKLESMYALSVCTPSRAALLTGRYPFTIGMQNRVLVNGDPSVMPTDVQTLPEMLKAAGYSTHLVGKWHLGDCSKKGMPTSRGFDSFTGFLSGTVNHYSQEIGYGFNPHAPMIYDFWNGTDILKFNKTVYTQDILTEETIRIIEKSEVKEPFFIFHSTPLPHAPLQVPESFLDFYPDSIEPDRRLFLGMLSAIDDAVGKMVESLRLHGSLDNTIIVFMSDNGGIANTYRLPPMDPPAGSNYPLRGSKYTLYNGGVRVPAFIYSPLFKEQQGKTISHLFHISDWFPTLAAVAGVEASSLPDSLDGMNQLGAILNPDDKKALRKELVIQIQDIDAVFEVPLHNNGSAAIIEENYKLIVGPAIANIRDGSPAFVPGSMWNQPDEWKLLNITKDEIKGTACGTDTESTELCLFNLQDDPSETKNLAIKYSEIVNRLLRRLNYYKSKIRAPVNPNRIYTKPYTDVVDEEGNLKYGACD